MHLHHVNIVPHYHPVSRSQTTFFTGRYRSQFFTGAYTASDLWSGYARLRSSGQGGDLNYACFKFPMPHGLLGIATDQSNPVLRSMKETTYIHFAIRPSY